MTLIHRFMAVLDWVLHRTRAEKQLDDELRSFVEMSAAEKIRDGVPPQEARRQALIELGGIEQTKERVRTSRHGAWLDEIARDVRYALRLSRNNPGFTFVVVLTLALGIGANTAIFSLIDALMLRWLPVSNPQEIVQLSLQPRGETRPGGGSLSWAIVRGLSKRRDVFAGVAGFSASTFEVGSPGMAAQVKGALVTGDFYDVLGLHPIAGRLITSRDDEQGVALVAVLSYGYWERQFARSPRAIGQALHVNGVPVTIVGVSPRGFVGANVGAVADITLPVAALSEVFPTSAGILGPGNFWLRVLARPQPSMTREQAAVRLNAIWPQIAGDVISPHWPPNRRKEMMQSVFHLTAGGTGWSYLREMYTAPLFVLMAGVALVLLIASANVASLLLARASVRRREMAIRLAIGAGRARIVRQLLIESMVLSSFAAILGVGLAWVSGEFLVGLISTSPSDIVFDLTPNAHVLGFTAGVAVITAMVFGVAPAFHATAAGPSAALKEDSRTADGRSRLLPWLVTGQVAISLVLLAGAALFVRTLQNLQTLDPGFRAEGVLLAQLDGRRPVLPQQIIDDVRRLPAVVSAALTTHTPLSGSTWSEPVVPAGQTIPERDNAVLVGAGPGFFQTMEIQLLAGREFTETDTASAPAVAIVNEAFAQTHFPGTNPVGQRLSTRLDGRRTDLEIVGLARNMNSAGLRREAPRTVFVAYAQLTGDAFTTVAVRASGPMARVTSELQQLLQSKIPKVSLDIQPLSTQVKATLVRERMMATLAGAFGLLALTLVCVGLYGLLAFAVAQRTKEIGIRMALGAQAHWVIRLVLGDGARLVGLGIAFGLPAAWIASRWTKSMLFGVTPTDPVAIAAALAVLVVAALVAAYLPARRASRLDPLTALRHE
jgi:putative ABC transport system permease protein